MYRFFIITLLPLLLLTGCAKYARLEQVKMGMPVGEFLQLPTPIYFRGRTDDTVQYGCRLNVPYGESLAHRAIRPYIMTFTDGNLTAITFDEEEQTRRELGNELHFGYGYRTRNYFLHHYYHP